MVEKRINLTMMIMSLIGGAVGFVIGEIIMNLYRYKLPQVVLVGLYFGILALCIGIMCLIAEMINPRLNGFGWKNNYLKTSFKLLIPCTLVLVFVGGVALQFLYQVGSGKYKSIQNVVFVIDTSQSMSKTDPQNERFSAVLDLMNSMNDSNRIAIYRFDETAEKILGMSEVNEETKNDASKKLEQNEKAKGNTNMRDALEKAYGEIESTKKPGKNAMVILLSDGGDNYDLGKKFSGTMEPFSKEGIPVYTIGMSTGNDFLMLKKISEASRGNYYNVKDVKNLKGTFSRIYYDIQQNLLIDKRSGAYETSTFYMVLRILLITFMACLITLAVSLVFDNKNLLRGFLTGGILAGILSGLILEFGFLHLSWMGVCWRALCDIIIALIFTLIPVKVDVKDYSRSTYMGSNTRSTVHGSSGKYNTFK